MNQKPSNFHFKNIEGKVHLPSKTTAKKNISPKMKKTNAPKRNEKPILISNEKDLEKVRKSYFDFVKKISNILRLIPIIIIISKIRKKKILQKKFLK